MQHRHGASLLVGILLACSACGKQAGGAGPGGFEMPPTVVETTTAERRPVRDTLRALGSIEALESVAVVAEIEGKVRSLPFEEGGRLRRGDLVAEIDDDQLRAEVARAEAIRDQQQSSYERVQRIVATKVGPAQDLDDAAGGLKVAEANLLVARTRLLKARITAPFDGVAGARRVSPGAFLRPGDPVTELAQVDVVKASFAAPERYLTSLAVGAEVQIQTAVFPGEPMTGRVALVDPAVDPATRSVRVVAHVKNPEGKLRPGMSADVAVVLAERAGAIVVPAEAVFAEGKEFLVYVVTAAGVVERTPVTLGLRLPDVVEVTAGLAAGTAVVRAGHQKLFPGAKVTSADAAGGDPPGGVTTADASAEGDHAAQ